jgi:hypothetical protein
MDSPSLVDGMLFYVDGREYSSRELESLPQSATPRHVLVIGMGRGGTTACAEILSALGFVCDIQGNPVFESRRLRALRRRGRAEEFFEEVARWDSGSERWFWKEPKLHAGEFRHAVLQAPESVGYLAVFRDVFNVALRNHHTMNIEFFASLQHAAHNNAKLTEFVCALRHRKLVMLSYEKLISRTDRIVRALAQYLGVQDEASISAAIASVSPEPRRYLEIAGPKLAAGRERA